MNRRIIDFAAAAVTFAGAAVLAAPAHAKPFGCTEEQWARAEAIANQVCPGASYSAYCDGPRMTVTILACPPGDG